MKIEMKYNEILNEIAYVLRTIVVSSVVVFLFTKLLFKPYHVDGLSMYPTLDDKDFGFSFVFNSLIDQYNRFDVVIVDVEDSKEPWIKRIIALPNETIEYKDDVLYINGVAMEEPFLDEEYMNKKTFGGTLNFTTDFGPITLEDNEYFLLGDNRLVSQDSRNVGPFQEDQILSTHLFVVYPF